MDAVTQANLDQFASAHDIASLDEEKKFEHFSAYCALSSVIEDSLDLDQVVIGEGSDAGLDAIAIIVNGYHVTEIGQVTDILSNNKYLDAQFIFIQSTTAASFDNGKIHKFLFGIEDFFSSAPSLAATERLENARAIKAELYSKAAYFKRGNPDVFCYYVTTGSWREPQDAIAIVNAAKERLNATNMLENITIEMVDARELQRLYRATQNSLRAELNIPNVITLPPIDGIISHSSDT